MFHFDGDNEVSRRKFARNLNMQAPGSWRIFNNIGVNLQLFTYFMTQF